MSKRGVGSVETLFTWERSLEFDPSKRNEPVNFSHLKSEVTVLWRRQVEIHYELDIVEIPPDIHLVFRSILQS